jgi:hypothetical protein
MKFDGQEHEYIELAKVAVIWMSEQGIHSLLKVLGYA